MPVKGQPRKRRAAKLDDDDEELLKPTPVWKYLAFLGLLCGGALQIILPLIDPILDLVGGAGFVQLAPENPELGKVFFGGHPWLVLCQNDSAPVPKIWDMAATLHSRSEQWDILSFGVLDCGAPLPSGKTTYQRFKLPRPEPNVYQPNPVHAFLAANGKAPFLIPSELLAHEDPRKDQAEQLVGHVVSTTKPRSRLLSNAGDLQSRCLDHTYCGLLLNPGKLSADDKEVMESLMYAYRTVKFVKLDTDKRSVSLQKSLPPVAEGEEGARFVLIKREKVLNEKGKKTSKYRAKAHRDVFSVSAMSPFLDQALNLTGTAEALPPLKKKPTMSKGKFDPETERARKKKAAARKRKKAREAAAAAAAPPPRPREEEAKEEKGEAEKAPLTPEQQEAMKTAQRERERRRREQMDREQEEAMMGQAEEEDEEDYEDEEEDEDEAAIDLDDEDEFEEI